MNKQGVIMRRTLLSITAVLAALTLFFAACENPAEPTSVSSSTSNPEEFAAISGPEWVKASAYPGAILVSWAFNKDAKNYSVYRQRSDGQDALVRLVTPDTANNQGEPDYARFTYLDIVSPRNQLADGVEYVYEGTGF
jgi:hypothetical protein